MNDAQNEKSFYKKIIATIIGLLILLSIATLAAYYANEKSGKKETPDAENVNVITREDIIKGSEARGGGAVTEEDREAILKGAAATVKNPGAVTEEERRAILEGANAKRVE